MHEHLKRHYTRDEEFLDEFGNVAAVAASFLGGAWVPDSTCDDDARRSREYFLESGELDQLVFDGGSVYHDAGGCSSAQIALRSAKRVVTVLVRREGGDLVAAKIVDRAASDAA